MRDVVAARRNLLRPARIASLLSSIAPTVSWLSNMRLMFLHRRLHLLHLRADGGELVHRVCQIVVATITRFRRAGGERERLGRRGDVLGGDAARLQHLAADLVNELKRRAELQGPR